MPTTTLKNSCRYRSQKLLAEAEGRTCVLCEFDGKINDVSTTVPAHLPGSFYGMPAGIAAKTHDWLVAHLCDEHHTWIDSVGRMDAEARMKALCLTLQRLFAEGVLIVAK